MPLLGVASYSVSCLFGLPGHGMRLWGLRIMVHVLWCMLRGASGVSTGEEQGSRKSRTVDNAPDTSTEAGTINIRRQSRLLHSHCTVSNLHH
jgi:hypothetical protein